MIVGVQVQTINAFLYQPRRSLSSRLIEWEPRHNDRLRVQFSDASEKLGPALLILYHASPSNSFPVSLGIRSLNKRNNVARLDIVLWWHNMECFQPRGSKTDRLRNLPSRGFVEYVQDSVRSPVSIAKPLEILRLLHRHDMRIFLNTPHAAHALFFDRLEAAKSSTKHSIDARTG